MFSRKISIMTGKVLAEFGKSAALAVALMASLFVVPLTAYARCQLHMPVGAAATIDGVINSATEWSDASETSSSTQGCFAGNVPVVVRAKRDANNLYLAFRVSDSTAPGAADLAERLIIQLSPVNLAGGNLGSGQSYKINVGHKRTQVTLDADRFFFRSSGTFSCSGTSVPAWQSVSWPAGLNVSIGETAANAYSLELVIPKAALGIAGAIPGDIAMSFILVDSAPPPANNAYASWFPSSLDVEMVSSTGQLIEGADPTGNCNNWTQTSQWGLASAAPSPDVWMARTPEWWWSDDVDTVKCPGYTGSGDQYNYHPATPCRFKVKYWLRNNNLNVEKRDVLVLAGVHGVGQLQWEKVSFKQGETVPAAASAGGMHRQDFLSVTNGTTDTAYRPPAGVNSAGHPCIRVYILPTADSPDFRKSRLMSQSNFTDQELQDLEAAYRLDIGKHMAQQNISRASTPACPDTGCQTAQINGAMPTAMFAALDWLSDLPAPAFGGLLPSAHAQPATRSATAAFPAAFSGRLLERYGRDHVIVKIEALSHGTAKLPDAQTYRINRSHGGVVQLFPVALLKEQGTLPVQMFVGNPKKLEQTVNLVTQVHFPAGFEKTAISIPTEPRTLKPGESFVMKGKMGAGATDTQGPSKPPICDTLGNVKVGGLNDTESLTTSLLMFGGLGVGGLAFLRRRKSGPREKTEEHDKS